jgi:hypothetical protein
MTTPQAGTAVSLGFAAALIKRDGTLSWRAGRITAALSVRE